MSLANVVVPAAFTTRLPGPFTGTRKVASPDATIVAVFPRDIVIDPAPATSNVVAVNVAWPTVNDPVSVKESAPVPMVAPSTMVVVPDVTESEAEYETAPESVTPVALVIASASTFETVTACLPAEVMLFVVAVTAPADPLNATVSVPPPPATLKPTP